MGDERWAERQQPTKSTRSGSKIGQGITAFWAAMIQMYGTRWSQTFSTEPLAAWREAFESLNNDEVRYAIRNIAKSGNPHPPSLPEVVLMAKNQIRAHPPKIEVTEGNCTPAEIMANRWFMSRAMKSRFVGLGNPDFDFRVAIRAGIERPTLTEIRRRAVETCEFHRMLQQENDPEATPDRLWRLLDDMAESLYPKEVAAVWRVDSKFNFVSAGVIS